MASAACSSGNTLAAYRQSGQLYLTVLVGKEQFLSAGRDATTCPAAQKVVMLLVSTNGVAGLMSLMRPAGTQFHLASVLIGVSQNDAGTTSFRHVKSQSIHISKLPEG